MKKLSDCNIVSLEQFIRATRDAGYRDVSSALSELIDNAFEAGAQTVRIAFDRSASGDVTVITSDDGCGMKASVLQLALQFGGSTRFNSRINSGRFGMGLPNSSLSQARRVDVFTWQKSSYVWKSYLDVDEIASGQLTYVPVPQRTNSDFARGETGTIVFWSKCDRIEIKNERVFLSKIRKTLGRVFRKQLWAGKRIFVGNEQVAPFDPLLLNTADGENSNPFGSTLEYDISVPNERKKISIVKVQFAELPIDKWHCLSNEEKQAKGISKNAGVSIIRAGREIDYGWYFTGKKRKENYDDWWRCEISFDPELDELFGVTNTKQGIRPTECLKNIISPDIERIANTLNSRVRTRFAKVKANFERSSGEKLAMLRDRLLEPPERLFSMSDNLSFFGLQPTRKSNDVSNQLIRGLKFRIESRKITDRSFYIPLLAAKEITVLLNENHPFYESIFTPSMQSSNHEARLLRQYLELTLLAAARAECTVSPRDQQDILPTMREEWSKVLATFLE